MMKRILIAEDDVNFRFYLSEMIPWKENGYEVIGTAVNGKQALEILEEKEADVLLTDMSMPLVNGVELTRKVRSVNAQTCIVVLSAYDDFGFVKEALTLGADDYYLKQDMEMEELIHKIDEVIQRKKQKTFHERLQYSWGKTDFLQYLCGKARLEEEERQNYCNRFAGKNIYIMLLDMKEAVSKTLVHYLEENREDLLFYSLYDEGKVILVWICDRIHSMFEERERQDNRCTSLRTVVQEIRGIYVGKMTASLEEIQEEYQKSETLAEYRFYYPRADIVYSSDLDVFLRTRVPEFRHEFSEDTYKENIDEIEKGLKELMRRLEEKRPLLRYFDYNLTSFYVTVCSSISKQYHAVSEDSIQILEKLQSCSGKEEKSDCIMSCIGEMMKRYPGGLVNNREISMVIDYIWKHLSEEISLPVLANYVSMSESYLSRRFSEEVGESLINYVNRCRIEQATQLLLTTTMKAYEISDAVGFNNSTYFATLFKKYTGLSVNEYKQQNR